MSRTNILLIITAIIVILITQTMAFEKYPIYIHSNRGIQNIYIEIFDDTRNRIDEGFTNGFGIFYSYLDINRKYHIYARGVGIYGEWEGYPNRDRIDIYTQ